MRATREGDAGTEIPVMNGGVASSGAYIGTEYTLLYEYVLNAPSFY